MCKILHKRNKKISERGQKSRQLRENRYSLLSSHVVLQISGKGKLDKAWVFPLGQLYYLTCLCAVGVIVSLYKEFLPKLVYPVREEAAAMCQHHTIWNHLCSVAEPVEPKLIEI